MQNDFLDLEMSEERREHEDLYSLVHYDIEEASVKVLGENACSNAG